jgi:hypothetical protein
VKNKWEEKYQSRDVAEASRETAERSTEHKVCWIIQ